MTTELNNLATAVKSTNDYIKAKPSDALKGLSADDCVDGLGAIITVRVLSRPPQGHRYISRSFLPF